GVLPGGWAGVAGEVLQMNHGQSKATFVKEALFGKFIGWSLDRFMRERRRSALAPYYGFDLNCGSGENRDNGANIIGSPLILKNNMEKRRINGRLYLCDKSKKALNDAMTHFISSQLELFRTSHVTASFIKLHNRKFVPTIPQRIREAGDNPRTAHGIIIGDPNGLHFPLSETAACVWECPRVDVLIHLYGMKRVYGYWDKH